MPGLFEVLNTLAVQVQNACYPNGILNPSVTTKQITIESGFPVRTQQDIDLSSGYSHVYVYPTDKQRPVTKFQREYLPLTKTGQTIFTNVSGTVVTITGVVSTPQSIMIISNGTGYGYAVQPTDTLNSIASNMADIIPNATALNNTISIPTAYRLAARVSTNFSAGEELSRIEGIFDIFIASPNPVDRSTILDVIDVYLKINFRIVGSDDFYLLLFYHDTKVTDMLTQEEVYKATLSYMIQYPTTYTNTFTSVTDPFVNSIEVEYQ